MPAVGDLCCFIHKSVTINCDFRIGRATYIWHSSAFGGQFPIKIGSFTSIGSGVYCWTAESHDIEHISSYPFNKFLNLPLDYSELVLKPNGVNIGNDVYIGQGVRIMPGVSIADGAVVGARAVVARDIGPYEIHGGVANKLIKKRFKDPIIEALLQIKWWKWPKEKIARNMRFFNLNLKDINDPNILFEAIID